MNAPLRIHVLSSFQNFAYFNPFIALSYNATFDVAAKLGYLTKNKDGQIYNMTYHGTMYYKLNHSDAGNISIIELINYHFILFLMIDYKKYELSGDFAYF